MKNLFYTLIKLPFIFIVVFLVIHILGLFGILISVGYLITFIAAPRLVPCFVCNFKQEGEQCRFCGKDVSKPLNPKNFKSALYNSLTLSILSLISLLLISVEYNALNKIVEAQILPTARFEISSAENMFVGEEFEISVFLQALEHPVNAVRTDLQFDSTKIEVLDIKTDRSFAKIFIEKIIDNNLGLVRITGGIPNPGFREPAGEFAVLKVKSKLPGLATVHFLPSSAVLTNDAKATDILDRSALPSSAYLIMHNPQEENTTLLEDIVTQPGTEGETAGLSTGRINNPVEPILAFSDSPPNGNLQKTSLKAEFVVDKPISRGLSLNETTLDLVRILLKVDETILGFWRSVISK